MKFLLNVLWFVFGGFVIAIEYLFSSIILMITVIGIPFGLQTLKMTLLAIAPFSYRVIDSRSSSGCLSLFMNILWIFVGGFWIALSHFGIGVVMCITIIGIPFGMQHFKLAKLSLFPFGKSVI